MPEGYPLMLAILDGFSERNEQGGAGRKDSTRLETRGRRRTCEAAVPVAVTGPTRTADALLRQLEIAAAVAGELESFLSLVGPGLARSPYALVS
jgi:hypothetical protein